MSKHTPGPWTLKKDRSPNGYPHGISAIDPTDELKFEVCAIFGQYNDRVATPMSAANARLIAAAPDLLEACEALIEGMDALGIKGPYLDLARSAVAKATHPAKEG